MRRPAPDGLSPGTRKTVAAISALLVSFAYSGAAGVSPAPEKDI